MCCRYYVDSVPETGPYLTALNRSPALFFLLYFTYMVTNNITANAVPTGVIYSTPMADLPFISSMRMLVMSGGLMILLLWKAHAARITCHECEEEEEAA